MKKKSILQSKMSLEVDGIYYNENGDGTVSVTYKGSSYDEYADEYTGDVVIPSSVTYSGTTYPVTSIGNYAFEDCSGLTSVTIPNSVTSIGDSAFDGCSGLKRVDISSLEAWLGINFNTYDSNPLYYAHHLYLNGEEVKDLVIPNSVTSIGDCAFYGCSGLTSVTIPNSVTSIGTAAFYGCSRLKSITIPDSVTSIGDYAFSDCSRLKSITIPNSVTSIGDDAFQGCSGLKRVSIPNSVKSIGKGAFRECSGLTSVDISSLEAWLGIKFENTYSNPLYYAHHLYLNGEEVKDLVIPNSVKSIGNYAFEGCSGLTSITIPNSVTEIGDEAFRDCRGLTRVDISSLEAWLGIKFEDTYSYSNPLFYAHHLYLNGEEVKDLVIPNSVKSIGNYAFDGCSGLTSVTIPNSVTSIGNYAFSSCSGLTSVTIPNSVTSIGNYAFSGCSSLTSVSIPNSVTSIGESAFRGCRGLTRVDISSLVAWLGIKFAGYYSNPLSYAQHLYLNGKEVKDLVIPNSVTSIGAAAFAGCSGLTSVSIPNSVTSIGRHAFNGCSGLTSVTIPNSVTSIGESAFRGCSGLTSIIIPNSVTSIGDYAFRYCSGLTSVTITNSVTSIGSYAFYGCSGLETIFYNAENCANKMNYSYVFNYGTNIIIGKDVKKVPNYLFYFLENAPTSVISKSVTTPTCGASTFNSNAYTAKLYVPSGAIADYKAAKVWKKFTKIEGIETNDAENVAD